MEPSHGHVPLSQRSWFLSQNLILTVPYTKISVPPLSSKCRDILLSTLLLLLPTPFLVFLHYLFIYSFKIKCTLASSLSSYIKYNLAFFYFHHLSYLTKRLYQQSTYKALFGNSELFLTRWKTVLHMTKILTWRILS
jgi:hypothetical protein